MMKAMAWCLVLIAIVVAVSVVVRRGIKPSQTSSVAPGAIPGEIVVGFQKDIPANMALSVLGKHALAFKRADDVNMGKKFFYETGVRFIVTVPPGDEEKWIAILSKETEVRALGRHFDPKELLID